MPCTFQHPPGSGRPRSFIASGGQPSESFFESGQGGPPNQGLTRAAASIVRYIGPTRGLWRLTISATPTTARTRPIR